MTPASARCASAVKPMAPPWRTRTMTKHVWWLALALLAGCSPGGKALAQPASPHAEPEHPDRWVDPPVGQTIHLTDAQWHSRLSPAEYRVLREHGTEIAFTGHWEGNHLIGIYRCAACGAPLFVSDTKFDSGTGWPSFFQPIPGRVKQVRDTSLGMVRTEIRCARCGSHLGHVFDDGPPPTGLRYCMNSVALDFDGRPARAHRTGTHETGAPAHTAH